MHENKGFASADQTTSQPRPGRQDVASPAQAARPPQAAQEEEEKGMKRERKRERRRERRRDRRREKSR